MIWRSEHTYSNPPNLSVPGVRLSELVKPGRCRHEPRLVRTSIHDTPVEVRLGDFLYYIAIRLDQRYSTFAIFRGPPDGLKLDIDFNVFAATIDICSIKTCGPTTLDGEDLEQVRAGHTNFDLLHLFQTVSNPLGLFLRLLIPLSRQH